MHITADVAEGSPVLERMRLDGLDFVTVPFEERYVQAWLGGPQHTAMDTETLINVIKVGFTSYQGSEPAKVAQLGNTQRNARVFSRRISVQSARLRPVQLQCHFCCGYIEKGRCSQEVFQFKSVRFQQLHMPAGSPVEPDAFELVSTAIPLVSTVLFL